MQFPDFLYSMWFTPLSLTVFSEMKAMLSKIKARLEETCNQQYMLYIFASWFYRRVFFAPEPVIKTIGLYLEDNVDERGGS
jgi:hypothetical protein